MNQTVKEVITGTNVEVLKKLDAKNKNAALEVVAIIYEDDSMEIHQYNDVKQTRVEYLQQMIKRLDELKNNRQIIEGKTKLTKLDTNSKKVQSILNDTKKQDALSAMGVTNLVYDEEEIKKDHKLAKGVAIGAGIVILAGGLYAGCQYLNNDNMEEAQDIIEEETGYGFYKWDLSKMEDMSEYESLVIDSEQKQGALNRLEILRNINNEVTLVDGKTKQLAGLTIEQLVAVDAYSNSNIYEREDYIKNFGLYDFSNVTDDFQQAVLVTGACLSNPEFDGTALADIFKDEDVKANYLKQLEYRDKILLAETSKEQKKLAKEYVEFLSDCSIDQSSSEYLDYDQHPGMAFATTVVVNALNYHNVVLDKEVVSELIIIGDEDTQSKVNSVCSDANAKIEAATEFVDILERALVENENTMIYNENEIKKAEKEEREPVLLKLQYEELDTIIREMLCDQEQINELTNKTLEKEGKLVTKEDQEIILADAVNIQRKLLDAGKGYYKDARTAFLASKLLKPGDTYTETVKGVEFSSPEEVAEIEAAAPEETSKAKEELNEREGLIDNTQGNTQEKIDEIIKDTAEEGQNYYEQVMNYFDNNGNVDGIPAELQEAFDNLGSDLFDLAKETGIARHETNDENKYSGGEINIEIDSDIDINDISEENNQIDNTTPVDNGNNNYTENTTPVDNGNNNSTENTTPVDNGNNNSTENTTPETTPTEENNSNNDNINIDADLSDIDITDISTDPTMDGIPTDFAPIVSDSEISTVSEDVIDYSLFDIYGIDEYSDFSEDYTETEEIGKTR